MAERADVIIAFTNALHEVFLENILQQEDGTGPDDLDDFKIPGTPLMKFIVAPGQRQPVVATRCRGIDPRRPAR